MEAFLMSNYGITGKLGGGKSLVTVSRMIEALREDRVVATNLDLNLAPQFGRYSKKTYIRLPDKPTVHDLEVIDVANESYDESKNGILALDELGTWFDSRGWQDKSRKPMINWFLHMRKRGWDGYFIIQDIESLDTHARRNLIEMTAFCKRLDRIKLPIIGGFVQFLTGIRLTLPRIHIAKVVYGTSETDLKVDRWTYTGTDLYSSYDTKQIFSEEYEHGTYSVLSPWHLNRCQRSTRNRDFYMRLTKLYLRKYSGPVLLAAGALLGSAASLAYYGKQKIDSLKPEPAKQEAPKSNSPKIDMYTSKIETAVANLYISGSMEVNSKREYQLALIGDPDVKTRFTNVDLARMGLIVRNRSDCHLDVTVGTRTIPILCSQSF